MRSKKVYLGQIDAKLEEIHGVFQSFAGRAPCRLPALKIKAGLAASGRRHAVIESEDRFRIDVERTARTRQLQVTIRLICIMRPDRYLILTSASTGPSLLVTAHVHMYEQYLQYTGAGMETERVALAYTWQSEYASS